jgi:hypothetical protein
MNEDITLTFILFDETKPLSVTEPFYNTVCHFYSLLKKVNISMCKTIRPESRLSNK